MALHWASARTSTVSLDSEESKDGSHLSWDTLQVSGLESSVQISLSDMVSDS